jgi:hypothetical protein
MLAAARSRLGIFNRRTTSVIIALQILLASQYSHAVDCTHYKDRIEHYEQLRSGGGKAKQMNHWQTSIDDLEEKLKQCNSAGRIQVVSGATTNPSTKTATKTTSRYIEASAVVFKNAQVPAQQVTDIIMVRKLKDCIKPNNLIDNDVSECMRGNLYPAWNR